MTNDKMGGLNREERERKRAEFVKTASQTTQVVKKRGRPTGSKSGKAISPRTVSLEDEYHDLVELLRAVPRRAQLSRSDVFRAALYHLAVQDLKTVKDSLEAGLQVTPQDIAALIDDIDKKLD
ncbi:hypothetical protein MWH03_00065 [Klebsiella pneumoniae]|nr:hypothetical protein [Klebsiella pneumoniae]